MKRTLAVTMFVFLSLTVMAQANDPLAVLQSDAGMQQKMQACRQLARIGGPEAVPVLEALLNDAQLSHMARYALEGNPAPEAGAALRRALQTVDDVHKVGIMSTLAVRRDTEAVPAMVRLLQAGSPSVRSEAARALSRLIALDADVDVSAVAERPEALSLLAPHLLHFAQRLLDADRPETAAQIYDVLRTRPEVPAPVQDAALRGTVIARGQDGLPLLMEALHGEAGDRFDLALRTARELEGGEKVTAALGAELATLPDWAKVPVLQVIGQRGGSAAGQNVLALAREGASEVRVAALKALTRMAYAPALRLFEELTWDPDKAVAQAAQDGLIYFPGGQGDGILRAMLERGEARTRLAAVELVARGGLEEPVLPLMKVVTSDSEEDIRVAALKALRDFAGADELSPLLAFLLEAQSPAERQAAENVLKAVCRRETKTTPADVKIRKAVYGVLSGGPSADVTRQVGAIVEEGGMSVTASNGIFGDPAPGIHKQLQVEYLANGVPMNKTVREGETMLLTAAYVPESIVQAFVRALTTAEGDTRLSLLRLLGATGGPRALEAVLAAAEGEDPAARDTAQGVLCAWPTPDALPAVMKLAGEAPDQDLKLLALRGAMRMLTGSTGQTLSHYATLLKGAKRTDERKLLLSGLARVHLPGAFAMALAQTTDDAVKAEAIQAVLSIAKGLGDRAREDTTLRAPSRWTGAMDYWRVEDGTVIGHSDADIPRNEFLWAGTEVGDFYLDLEVKIEPNSGNGGIQFRSRKIDDHGQAQGYQADVGQGYWGRLYHEHGRGMLDATAAAEAAVKPGEWNRYEILAVGPAMWTAINGTLGAAFLDTAPDAEGTGGLAFQLHGGAPQTVQYRIRKLVHNPAVKLSNQDTETLVRALKP